MGDEYVRSLLRCSVSQICQTIGYNSTQSTSLELLHDLMNKFLLEFCRCLRRNTEHYNRTDPNLDDAMLTLSILKISANELLEYIHNVEPVPFVFDVPEFPINNSTKLNFLKPGSKEVLSRPVHIFEYLPAILPPDEIIIQLNLKHKRAHQKSIPNFISSNVENEAEKDTLSHKNLKNGLKIEGFSDVVKAELSNSERNSAPKIKETNNIDKVGLSQRHFIDHDGRPKKEISSVVMTTGGFLSPAVEGRLPESIIPEIIETLLGVDAMPSKSFSINYDNQSHLHADTKRSANVSQRTFTSSKREEITSVTTSTSSPTDDKSKNPIIEKCIESNVMTAGSLESNCKLQSIFLDKCGSMISSPTGIAFNSVIGEPFTSQGNDNCDTLRNPIMAKKLLKKAKIKTTISEALTPIKNQNEDNNNNPLEYSENAVKEIKMSAKMLQKLTRENEIGLHPKQKTKKQGKHNQNNNKNKININFQVKSYKNISHFPKNTGDAGQEIWAFESKQDSNVVQCNIEENKLLSDPQIDRLDANLNANIKEVINITPNANSLQMKLKNEPDKTKLNILKKITSKQKYLKPAVQTNCFIHMSKSENSNKVEEQVINLPSGTTITPAPVMCNKITDLNEKSKIITCLSRKNTNLETCISSEEKKKKIYDQKDNETTTSLNKSKKRGRKPGGKNNVNSFSLKSFYSQEVIKFKNADKHLTFPISTATISNPEPLNLSNTKQFVESNSCSLQNIGTPFLKSTFLNESLASTMPQLIKQTKSEKKVNNKHCSILPNSLDAFCENQVLKNDEQKSNLNCPADLYNLHMGESVYGNKFKMTSKVPKKHFSNMQSTSNVGSFMQPSSSVFPNMHLNGILPLLPLYPFTPRPGLIPTPALFPTPGQFSMNDQNASTINLLPSFLPVHTLKTPILNNTLNQEPSNFNTTKSELSDILSQTGDNNFCKVSPFVPESMKVPSTDSNFLHKTKQIDLKSSLSSKIDCLQIKQSLSNGIPECSSMGNKSILSTTLNNCKNTFTQQENINSGIFLGGLLNDDTSISTLNNNTILSHVKHINENDTIEVSDESEDISSPIIHAIGKTYPLPLIKPTMNTSSKSLMEFDNTVNSSDISKIGLIKKGVKKLKRVHTSLTENRKEDSFPHNFSVANSENTEISKLAGGADLIPLSFPMLSKGLTNCLLPEETKFPNITITPTVKVVNFAEQKNRKEHKKIKKLKEGKIKKKKEKKSKIKPTDLRDKYLSKSGDLDKKEILKKIKKRIKKEKQLSAEESTINKQKSTPNIFQMPSNEERQPPITELEPSNSINEAQCFSIEKDEKIIIPVNTLVPKITLRLGGEQSPLSVENSVKGKSELQISQFSSEKSVTREPSPELARFSPLVTRPAKPKCNDTYTAINQHVFPLPKANSSLESSLNDLTSIQSPNTWMTTNTLSANSVLLPQQLLQTKKYPHLEVTPNISQGHPDTLSTTRSDKLDKKPTKALIIENNRPSSYIDAEGNRVWICPACGKVDDGSAMIGCDGCDAWYHWICVGIVVAPNDNDDWFCRVCIIRKKGINNDGDKKRKRNKKK